MATDPFADIKIDGLEFVSPHEEEHKQAVELANAAIQQRSEEFNERMAGVTRDLQGTSNATPMPLSVFEMLFYPMFAGEISQEEHVKRLHAWTLHAGGSYAEVPIVDDVTKKELFRVPGLITSDILNEQAQKLRDAGVPSLGVTQNHLTALRNSGRVGEADEIEEAELLKRVPDKATVAPHAVFNMLRWNLISSALGKPPMYPKLAKVVEEHDKRAKANSETAAEVVEEVIGTVAPTTGSHSVFDELF